MLPRAELRHTGHDRFRIGIPERRRNSDYFERARRELRSVPGVERVDGNPVTATLRVIHRPGTDAVGEIRRAAEERQLFLLASDDQRVRKEPLTDRIREPFKRVDSALRESSSGEVDLRSVAVVSILGLTAFQILRRRTFLPVGGSLLWYAVGLLQKKQTP